MTQEEKELLLRDLSERLPYGVKVKTPYNVAKLVGIVDRKGVRKDIDYTDIVTDNQTYPLRYCQPYLRPMSSMTEEEHEELLERLPKYWSIDIDKLGDLYFDISDASYPDIYLFVDIIDWLNAHHFDYRGLIEKGLALEATKGMYNIKE